MKIFSRKTRCKARVLVIGLDGVPFHLIQRLAEEGTMPFTAALLAEGHLHRMKVTLPEISSVSWTSFMTGQNPGRHGVFGFFDLLPNTKELRFPTFKDLKAPTFWDRLGEQGKRCLVLNQPSTYPARPIPGALVSGFVALDLRKSVYPQRIFPELEKMGYELDIDTMKARGDREYLWEALDRTLKLRKKALDYLWDLEKWDYLQAVVTGTDRLQHFLWDACENENHPLHGKAIAYYAEVDRFIEATAGRFFEEQGNEQGKRGLLLLSDHGFTAIRREFNLNAWLKTEGYLRLKGGASFPTNLSSQSRAFALDPNRIYFNSKDRFSDGFLDSLEREKLAEEIEDKLLSLSFENDPVVRRVFRRDEIYSGPQAVLGPDLVVLTHSGFDPKGTPAKEDSFTLTDLKGMHTWDDAFCWSVEKLKDDLNIVDLASIIERRLDSPK